MAIVKLRSAIRGFGCLIVFLLLVACGGAGFYALFRRDLPHPGWAIPSSDAQTIRSTCALEDDEQIIYFFALDFFTNVEDGSFFTNRRVVNYANGTDPTTVKQARYDEIEDIGFDTQYVWHDQAKIVIKRKD